MIASLAVQAVLAGAAFAQNAPPPAAPAQSQGSPAAPAPAPAPGGSAPSNAAPMGGLELKAALCQIDGILAPMDGTPVPASEAALCQPQFSIENVPQYLAAGGKTLDFGRIDNALVAYYEYRALAFGGPQQCGALVDLQQVAERAAGHSLSAGSNWESNCKTHYNEMKFVQALITRDPKAAAYCETWTASDPDRAGQSAAEIAATCQKVAAATNLRAFGASVCEGKAECQDFFRAISGDAGGCAGLSRQAVSHRVLCKGYVAFAQAGPEKNAALCGDNTVCLAMAGSAVRAAVDAQNEVAANLGPVLLPAAQAKLKALAGAVDPTNEAVAKELDSRAERIAALRMKYKPTDSTGGARGRAPAPARKGAGNEQ